MAKRRSAEELAKKQKAISVSEFFAKNRHLLGFDNSTRALMTTIKEAVDNSIDACDEARILPEIEVSIQKPSGNDAKNSDWLVVTVTDNGPGIVKAQIGKIFGKLLYGSKFHRLKQSRGQQGIGISAAGMYSMLTTGKAVKVTSCTNKNGRGANYARLQMDTKTNEPIIHDQERVADEWREGGGTGTKIEMTIVGRIVGGKNSIKEYIEQTAVANPHAKISYKELDKDWLRFERSSSAHPDEPKEIKPHPSNIDVGVLINMLQDTKGRTLAAFLRNEFCRVSGGLANKTCKLAGIDKSSKPREVDVAHANDLARAMSEVKYPAPPTDCLSPIGETQITAALDRFDSEFSCATSRPPAVYRGNPFQIEVGLAFGSKLSDGDDLEGEGLRPARLIRLANRVPLLYQQGACAISQATTDVSWKSYGLPQPRGGLPVGDLVILVHIASVWVPFTSESKEAVASYDEVIKEIKLGLQQAGRKLSSFLKKKNRMRNEAKRKELFEIYIRELSSCVSDISGVSKNALAAKLRKIAAMKTTGEVDDEQEKEQG
jgi:DNA topoisomerase-6 subunit B